MKSFRGTRCDRHGLAYDPAVEGGCVRCRREGAPVLGSDEAKRPGTPFKWGFFLATFLMGAWVLLRDDRQADTPSPPQVAPAAAPALTTPPVAPAQALSAPAAPSGQAGALTVTNRFGRSGAYFLPAGFDDAPRPLLVALHGSGWNGSGFLLVLRPFAEEQGLLVLREVIQWWLGH